ncbi:outer membrane protein assembly factor BamC [Zooshikella ganghwensis]|uniref:Outer membrane protein assembly factor BamC n=1 Tax=Zooshikella ganghwensis TaxID=202772 RepID=A0A4P9VMG7_9GAMM|nr:outer membrane protein assembly factor BamC [Zooshikella ganghwensis]RDH43112.1 outer membrane protein assembly factor BamC [Zooshikella ganghwensis]
MAPNYVQFDLNPGRLKCLFVAFSITASALLSGCGFFGEGGYIRDRSNDYLKAEQAPRLKLPERLAENAIDDTMVIPEINQDPTLPDEFRLPRPERVVVKSDNVHYQILKRGSLRWMITDKDPGYVWQELLSFWKQNKISVENQDASAGVMETAWLTPREYSKADFIGHFILDLIGDDDEDLFNDKFRVFVTKGAETGETQVFVMHARHTKSQLGDEKQVDWEKAKQRTDAYAAGMLNELLLYFSRGGSGQQVVDTSLDLSATALLEEDGNGNPALLIKAPFERSWAATGQALAEANVKVADKNRSAGLYYIAVGEDQEPVKAKDEDPGFFSRMFGDESEEDGATKPTQYQIRVTPFGNKVYVSVEKDINTIAPKDLSQDLLRLIKDNLR